MEATTSATISMAAITRIEATTIHPYDGLHCIFKNIK